MNVLAIGPTELFISALFNRPRYDEHVKAWRWDKKSDKGNLHVIDYYLYHAIRRPEQ